MNRLTLMQRQSPLSLQHLHAGMVSELAHLCGELVPSPAGNSPDQSFAALLVLPCNENAKQARHSAVALHHHCLMLLTVPADCIDALRRLLMRACGELIVSIRTQPLAHANRAKVWLCLNSPGIDLVMHEVMQALPCAEFGPITHD